MRKTVAYLASLACLVVTAACAETPTLAAPGAAQFDGGWVGPGGRSATDSTTVNTTDTATCSEERGGGWVGPGGRVEDPCGATSLGQ